MTNKKLNIILGIVSVILIVIFLYLVFLYKRNEESKIYFHENEIVNIDWINKNGDKLNFKNGKMTLILDDNEILKNDSYKLNDRTGKLDINNKDIEIYLRSVGNDNIVIWYQKKEYHFEKKVVLK